MILTDREWLRFVTSALVVGGVFGSLTAGAFLLEGIPPMYGLGGAVCMVGGLGVGTHLSMRVLLDRASEPPAEQPEPEPESETA